MNTHLRGRSYAPRQTSRLGPSHFLSKTLSRPALEVNHSSPKIAGQGAHYRITSQYHWVSEKHQKQLPSFLLRAAQGRKEAKKSPGLRRWRAGREQGHILLRLRWPSSRSLVLIQACAFFLRHLQLSRRTWQPILPVNTSQNKPKKPTWCTNQ